MIFPTYYVSSPRFVCPDLIATPPFLPESMWIFLYSLGCTGVFLPVSSLFSVRIAPDVDVFLMYLWREVSSMSSFFAILISSGNGTFKVLK